MYNMELIEENDMEFIKLVAAEFSIERSSFRAFFSYRNGIRPAFALVINYYRSPKGMWKSFITLQEPYDFIVTPVVYEKLRNKLQIVANGFVKMYNKGAEIDAEVDHVISTHSSFGVRQY